MRKQKIEFDSCAKALIEELNLIYDPKTQEIYYYKEDAGVWKIFDISHLKNIIYQFVSTLTDFPSNFIIEEVLEFCKVISVMPEGKSFNSNKDILVLKNGVYNLSTKELLPFSKDFFSTIRLDINYDSNAQCSRWLKYLEEVFNADESLIKVAQEMAGYCLTSSVKHQVAFFLLGEGSDGKSVFLSILQNLLGAENVSNIPFHKLDNHHYLSNLHGKLVNIGTEIDSSGLASSSNFKALVAGDFIQVDPKFKKPFSLKPIAKFVFAGNSAPKTQDRSYGYKRRIVILPFNRTFKGDMIDKELTEKLLKELDGIFLWAIEGLKRLEKQDGFTKSEAIEKAIQDCEAENNPLKFFLEEKCILSPNNKYLMKSFRKEYVDWCLENGYRALSAHSTTKELKRLGITKSKSNGIRYYLGLSIEPENEQESLISKLKCR